MLTLVFSLLKRLEIAHLLPFIYQRGLSAGSAYFLLDWSFYVLSKCVCVCLREILVLAYEMTGSGLQPSKFKRCFGDPLSGVSASNSVGSWFSTGGVTLNFQIVYR